LFEGARRRKLKMKTTALVISLCLIATTALAGTEVKLSCDHCKKVIDPGKYSRYHYTYIHMKANAGSTPDRISDEFRFCGKRCTLNWLLEGLGEKLRESWTLPPKGKGISYRYNCNTCGYVKWESSRVEKLFCGQCAQESKANFMSYTGEFDEKDVTWHGSVSPVTEPDDVLYYWSVE
jgi:hypothetical protein